MALSVASVVGARPQFIKTSPITAAAAKSGVRHLLIHTGQHYDYEMSESFFQDLRLPVPDYHLQVGSGSHAVQTALIMERLEPVLAEERPDWVLVYGDTNSTLAASITAVKLNLPVAHVEAGLRSFRMDMPEEVNRVLTDHVSSLLFCPTATAVRNLVAEGIGAMATPGEDAGWAPVVIDSGDVMYDVLLSHAELARQRHSLLEGMGIEPGRYSLATIHRQGNTDDPAILGRLLRALNDLNEPVVFPMHPRTEHRMREYGLQAGLNLRVIKPLGYLDMIHLEQSARVVLTDSGGVQKEAFLLGVPCVTLREETEWVETVESGWNRLAGTDPDRILTAVRQASRPATRTFPYGDGHSAEIMVDALKAYGKAK